MGAVLRRGLTASPARAQAATWSAPHQGQVGGWHISLFAPTTAKISTAGNLLNKPSKHANWHSN